MAASHNIPQNNPRLHKTYDYNFKSADRYLRTHHDVLDFPMLKSYIETISTPFTIHNIQNSILSFLLKYSYRYPNFIKLCDAIYENNYYPKQKILLRNDFHPINIICWWPDFAPIDRFVDVLTILIKNNYNIFTKNAMDETSIDSLICAKVTLGLSDTTFNERYNVLTTINTDITTIVHTIFNKISNQQSIKTQHFNIAMIIYALIINPELTINTIVKSLVQRKINGSICPNKFAQNYIGFITNVFVVINKGLVPMFDKYTFKYLSMNIFLNSKKEKLLSIKSYGEIFTAALFNYGFSSIDKLPENIESELKASSICLSILAHLKLINPAYGNAFINFCVEYNMGIKSNNVFYKYLDGIDKELIINMMMQYIIQKPNDKLERKALKHLLLNGGLKSKSKCLVMEMIEKIVGTKKIKSEDIKNWDIETNKLTISQLPMSGPSSSTPPAFIPSLPSMFNSIKSITPDIEDLIDDALYDIEKLLKGSIAKPQLSYHIIIQLSKITDTAVLDILVPRIIEMVDKRALLLSGRKVLDKRDEDLGGKGYEIVGYIVNLCA